MYCQKIVGDQGFSIDEWNDNFDMCVRLDLSETEISKILDDPEPIECTEQCIECATIVMERRLKTMNLSNRPASGAQNKG